MTVVSTPKDFVNSWQNQYHVLARKIAGLLGSFGGTLVEIGCGKGQLTVPLAKLLSKWRIEAVDSFAYPYSADYKSLVSVVSAAGLKVESVLSCLTIVSGSRVNKIRHSTL